MQRNKRKGPIRLMMSLWLGGCILGLFLASNLSAAQSARSQHTEVSLVSEAAVIAPGQPFTVALRMRMDPEWHTYWKNPGDAGLATRITWKLPRDFSTGPIQWPAPQRIETGGLVSFGYEEEAWLLVEVQPPASLRPGSRVTLSARVEWLECKEICLPGSAELNLSLPVGRTMQKAAALEPSFDSARAALPQRTFTKLRAEDHGSEIVLVLEQASARLVPRAFFFPEQEQLLSYTAPQQLEPAAPGLRLRMRKADNAIHSTTLSGVLRVEGPQGVVYLEVPELPLILTQSASAAGGGEKAGLTLWVLGLGFLGGLILNLMPCVFPVLGIKIMGLVQQAGMSPSTVLRHGLAYTGGVLISFWLLAGMLLLLRAGGAELGWGFQLQNPGFVFTLTSLLLVFGLNMSGVFEVGTSLIGTGARATSAPSWVGSFLSGALATVVATPCAAPFLAPALGAALALPPLPSLLLFTAIALGLASPFLLLSAFPKGVRFLPRPGPWMETLKQGLAFLLYAAAAYLLWVLAGQVEEAAFLAALLSLVVLGAAAWIYGKTSGLHHSSRRRNLGLALAIVLSVGALSYGWPSSSENDAVSWEPWSPLAVQTALEQKRPVYVDFTARWCATCQVNKRVVFGSAEVRKAFRERRVVALKADWTNQDPQITAELARFGRSAVPFNLIYLPGRDEPIILPEVLTPGVVLEALASGTR